MNSLDLNFNEQDFLNWYNNWRTDDMPVKPDNYTMDIWIDSLVDKFANSNDLVGKTVWYAVGQDDLLLTSDVYFSGVFVKSGKITKETDTEIWIDGLDYFVNKRELTNTVFERGFEKRNPLL